MIVNQLKKSILQCAFSGKLVNQQNGDTSVDTMLKNIMIQKGKVKSKISKFSNFNAQEEPFEIPKSWKWVELKDICLDIYAGGDKPKKFSKIRTEKFNIPVIANGETNCGIVGYTDIATENDKALTVAGRGTIGYSVYRMSPFTPIVRLLVIKLPDEINYKYLQRTFELLIESGVGTSIKQLTVPMIVNKLIPLPPIEEQQRIVDKIEEMFSKLDEVALVEEELINLKNKFSVEMRKSILESAMKGKLTIQNKNENVDIIINSIIDKHKKIREIDRTIFDIPANWKWIKFGDLVDFSIGKTPPRADNSYWGNDYNWVSISDMVNNGFVEETKEKVSLKAYSNIFKGNISKSGTLIMSFKLTVGKCSILKIDAFHNEGIISIYPRYESEILKKYLLNILPFVSKYGDTKGAIKGNTLNSKSLDNLLIPLPPIEEQQRIVDKLEQLLPLCNDIENLVSED